MQLSCSEPFLMAMEPLHAAALQKTGEDENN